jgi:leucine-rich repeat protein SHOC2
MNPLLRASALLFLGSLAAIASAQILSQTALDSTKEFYSIESAMKDPDKVYRLQLTKKKYKVLPEEIRRFKNLNALDLGKNKLKELPEWLGELIYMQEFRAPQNKLGAMPAVVCQWPHLKRLDLHQNEITGLLPCMGELTEVVSLDLWSNDLEDFPDELKGMTGLRFMDLRVIQFDQGEMTHISELFPQVKIFFSQPCNCGVGD